MDDDARGFCFNFDGTEPAVLCGDDDNNNKHNNDNNNDGIACATAAAALATSSSPSCASPSVAVSSFAWHTLTPAVVTRWLARYPAPPQSAVTRTTTTKTASTATRPMQLQLPLRDAAHDAACRIRHNDDVVVTVHYQSAAELVHLCTPARRDVVPGSYYGSLKVWSCAPQLAHYLVTHADEWRPRLARAAVVAELGCGQGVVGLTAMCLGARRLLFHDYNAEVLECCVQPNVAATWTAAATTRAAAAAAAAYDDDEEVSVQFVHGDWASLCYDQASSSSSTKDDDDSNTTTATSARCCDVVLGSDVTFDPTACAKLAEVLQRWLCPRHGVALIATKLYYFGTHGGSDVFTREAGQRGLHVAEVARVCDERAMWQVILRVTTSQATTAT